MYWRGITRRYIYIFVYILLQLPNIRLEWIYCLVDKWSGFKVLIYYAVYFLGCIQCIYKDSSGVYTYTVYIYTVYMLQTILIVHTLIILNSINIKQVLYVLYWVISHNTTNVIIKNTLSFQYIDFEY